MKTLIYQNNIGNITQWDASDISKKFINEICIPSVLNYAKKHNYDYKINTKHISPNFGKNFLLSEGTYISCNKYFLCDQNDYEKIVYIDNDVYIFDNAEKLPDIKNLSGIAEPKESECHYEFSRVFKLNPQVNYISSGVLMFDKLTGKKLKKYFTERFLKQRKGGWKNTDNGILNEAIYVDKVLEINQINKKWNYMPHLCEKIDNTKPNFIHFVGGDGKKYIRNLYAQSSNVKEYLEKLFW